MSQLYNWSSFYEHLCQHGPGLLLGIDEDVRAIIAEVAGSTDMFWSDGLQDHLAQGSAQGDLRAGVLAALDLWRENVLTALEANFAIELEWGSVQIDRASPNIGRLVQAAAISTQSDGQG